MNEPLQPDADVIIVGSGPAGVSAAFPLVETGLRVLMIDGGKERDRTLLPTASYHHLRRTDPEQWRYFLGPRLEGLRRGRPPSPKFDAPGSLFAVEGFGREQRIETREFVAVGSLARGGLSSIWGAGVTLYDEDDLHDFCISPADLEEPYRAIAGRIGITGFGEDDLSTRQDALMPVQSPLPLCENAAILLRRYGKGRQALHRLGFRLGRSRAAVLTAPAHGRLECGLCDSCVWGCHRESLYSADQDVRLLQLHSNFRYFPGLLATGIARVGNAYRLSVRPLSEARGEAPDALLAPVLMMAAGALASTRLILAFQGRYNRPVPVVVSPALGFGMLLPGRLGSAVSESEYSMAQISFTLEGEPGRGADRSFGSLFPATGLPGALIVQHMPLTRPGAIAMFRWLQPALLLGNCFLPGRFSRNEARLMPSADGVPSLVIQGGVSDLLAARREDLRNRLTRAFRRLGAWIIPNSVKAVQPGEDMRYCGTLPMSDPVVDGGTDRFGQVAGSHALFAVDLSTFPTMPAKHHTLTLMANAHRIGAEVARRLKAGGRIPGAR